MSRRSFRLEHTFDLEDGPSMSFMHLDVRSYFSLKEGAFAPEQLAEQAAGLGMPAVAMTDRDGLYGAAPFREAFGYRCVVAVEHRLETNSATEIHRMLRFAEKLDAVAVATNPVRYLVPDDAFLADALECMREIVPVASSNVSRTNAEGWLKPPAEMRALFAERPDRKSVV